MIDNKRTQLVRVVDQAIDQLGAENEILEVAVRMIDSFSDGYNWTGFYMTCGDHLEVGPYIGPRTDHTRIEINTGICGAAASTLKTVKVDDVRSDERFLVCSITTRSEIVVPLLDGDICLGEIDIDSDTPAFFTDDDKVMLEQIAELIVTRLKAVRQN